MSSTSVLLVLFAAAIKAGLLLAVAAGIVRGLGRAPARARHSVWVGALTGALLVPLLAPWVPDWSIAALPTPAIAHRLVETAPAMTRPAPTGRSSVADMQRGLGSGSARDGSAAGTVVAGSPSLRSRVTSIPPVAWVLGLWAMGCLASVAWFLRAWLAARRLARHAAQADSIWQRQLAAAQNLVGVRREVRLLVSPRTATPMTWGWLRPVVLMPARAAGWSAERRRVVLLHELVHVKRADWLVRLLARAVCSLYWPNPLAWVVARRLAVEQEVACDEEVVSLGTRPSSYARHLLAIARSLEPMAPTSAHALDMARRSQMEGRLMSILDGRRRLRGGRKLVILALLLIAGLVPALAAIEPWAEEQEVSAPLGESGATTPSPGTEEVARVLGELEALEERMEPFESELEAIEVEMGPVEVELGAIEVEMGPVEVELESLEVELEPFEEMLEAVEAEMEPFEARLEAIEVELEPFEERLQAIEVDMGPYEEMLEAIEVDMEPFEAYLEAVEVEMGPLEKELERLTEEMEPLARDDGAGSVELERLNELMEQIQERMKPIQERMGTTLEEMEPLFERLGTTHESMRPLHERMGAVHEEMKPVYERLASVHQEMEPLYERMAEIHEQMEPVHERMGEVHERMKPVYERMGEHHERLEPYHRKMGEMHERMRPLYEEMGERHHELERELAGLVERMLATELAGVTAADTDYAPVAVSVVDAVSIRVEGGVLRVRTSPPGLHELLRGELEGRITASDMEFAEAAERFARGLSELEVRAP